MKKKKVINFKVLVFLKIIIKFVTRTGTRMRFVFFFRTSYEVRLHTTLVCVLNLAIKLFLVFLDIFEY